MHPEALSLYLTLLLFAAVCSPLAEKHHRPRIPVV